MQKYCSRKKKNYNESLYTSITENKLLNEYDEIIFPGNIEAKFTDGRSYLAKEN